MNAANITATSTNAEESSPSTRKKRRVDNNPSSSYNLHPDTPWIGSIATIGHQEPDRDSTLSGPSFNEMNASGGGGSGSRTQQEQEQDLELDLSLDLDMNMVDLLQEGNFDSLMDLFGQQYPTF
jgi:hypothetical protein